MTTYNVERLVLFFHCMVVSFLIFVFVSRWLPRMCEGRFYFATFAGSMSATKMARKNISLGYVCVPRVASISRGMFRPDCVLGMKGWKSGWCYLPNKFG